MRKLCDNFINTQKLSMSNMINLYQIRFDVFLKSNKKFNPIENFDLLNLMFV